MRSADATGGRLLSRGVPTGTDPLAVRERYLRRRRRVGDRGWITMWVTCFAVFAWLVVAGVAGLGH